MGPYEVAHAFLYSNANGSPDEETRTLAGITLRQLEGQRADLERLRVVAEQARELVEILDPGPWTAELRDALAALDSR